jgi:MFS transporter, DHA1 family, multidrug resistance protein
MPSQSAIYGLSPLAFGATLAIGSAGYILATLVAARTVVRFGLDRTVGVGSAGMALGGSIMAAITGLASPHLSWFVGAMMLYFAGLGFAVPASRAGALTPFRDRAAPAASVMGFTQQMGAAIAATVVGFYLGHSAWPIASVVAVMGCMSFLIWLATRRIRAAR